MTGLLSDLLRRVTEIGINLDVSRKSLPKPLIELCVELTKKNGEASNLAIAQQILARYQTLSLDEKLLFFNDIYHAFGSQIDALDEAINNWQTERSEAHARALHFASEPGSQELLRRLNQAPNGTASIVKMRADLLLCMKKNAQLRSLDKDFSHLFASWFNRGFLQLKQINWQTSASVLEKVIAYEAVHEIQSWEDLRRRVDAPDRRLYGYFHPALEDEPLIFVEVALTDTVPSAIAPILSDKRTPIPAHQTSTAVFYSISNCQKGLRGISFGNFLIKQVVENLRLEFSNLDTFITLSPIPGLRAWATQQLATLSDAKDDADIALIQTLESAKDNEKLPSVIEENESLKQFVAHYLVNQRSPRGGAIDPVSRFHLGNGAQLENIHLMADLSEKGINNAWGCMVNYLYHVKNIEKNHEAYTNNDEIITSPKVTQLLKKRQ